MNFKILLLVCIFRYGATTKYEFPSDFIFGVSTAAYQIEGAWNEDGKGPSIWDNFTHEHPELIYDGSNGDIACDAYHKAVSDVQLLRTLGVDFYRFSISWSRLLPTGYSDDVNSEAVNYYNSLINELLNNNIQPMVTLYHWDLPQALQDIGGWPNEDLIDLFANYARVAFENFGDRVKWWITFNEAKQTCLGGYGRATYPPMISNSGIDDYKCTHTVLKSHAKVYHLYDDEFRAQQNGRISITIDTTWYEPYSNSDLDLEAQERIMQFNFGWFANPIFSPDGDYPQVMKDRIVDRSIKEGYSASRLPEFTTEEVNFIKGTHDFFGLNLYTTYYAAYKDDPPIGVVSYDNDLSVNYTVNATWPKTVAPWLFVVPWGARRLLNWVKDRYDNPEVIITENGFPDTGDIIDSGRMDYYNQYLAQILISMYDDNCNIKGYTAWSFMDNYEWRYGYSQKYGLYRVDFNDPNRARSAKLSTTVFRDIIRTRTVTILPPGGGGKANNLEACKYLLTIVYLVNLFN